MPQIPHRITDTPWEQAAPLLDDNFDKTVQDIGDLGAKFSQGMAIYSTTSLSPGSMNTASIDVTADPPDPHIVPGRLEIIPRVEVWEDNNLDDDYLVGYNNSQSDGCQVTVWVQRRRSNDPDALATFTVQLFNNDSSSHTYYVKADVSYQPAPSTGNFR